jgi:hypothetical protein
MRAAQLAKEHGQKPRAGRSTRHTTMTAIVFLTHWGRLAQQTRRHQFLVKLRSQPGALRQDHLAVTDLGGRLQQIAFPPVFARGRRWASRLGVVAARWVVARFTTGPHQAWGAIRTPQMLA